MAFQGVWLGDHIHIFCSLPRGSEGFLTLISGRVDSRDADHNCSCCFAKMLGWHIGKRLNLSRMNGLQYMSYFISVKYYKLVLIASCTQVLQIAMGV